MEPRPEVPGDRGVWIGRDALGNQIITGDSNVATTSGQNIAFPLAESIDIRAELEALRAALAQLRTDDRLKIDNALDEAEEELGRSEPSKDEIGGALERALKYARQAQGFADVALQLQQPV